MTNQSAMQPTSSASSAEQRDIVAKAIYDAFEYTGAGSKPSWCTLGNSQKQDEARRYAEAALSAIVPQVVQAPSVQLLVEALQYYADGEHFTLHDPSAWDTVSGEPANFQEDESNTATVEDGSVAKMALDHFKANTAPIVATVPSEPVAWIWKYANGEEEVVFVDASKRTWDYENEDVPSKVTPLYAAPSPTEQASDVRNAALEEAAIICSNQAHALDNGNNLYVRSNDCLVAAHVIRQRKLATPADKGNAPAEAKSSQGAKQ